MELKYKKSFVKEAKKLPKGYQKQLEGILDELLLIKDITDFTGDVSPMQGNYFRIRMGGYRIGIEVVKPDCILFNVMSRGDIYKKFPPK